MVSDIDEGLFLLLRKLSYTVRLVDMQYIFNRSRTYISRVCTMTADLIVRKYGHLLDFHPGLDAESMRQFELALQVSELGCPMPRVTWDHPKTMCAYARRKTGVYTFEKLHGLNYQAIVVPSG